MDMLSEVLSWGAKIQFITGDSWYSSTGNLKTIRNMVFDLCLVSTVTVRFPQKKDNCFNCVIARFPSGQVVWLKDFGFVQLFKTQLKEQQRFYIVHQDEDDLLSFEGFHELHSSHWKIEQYHRVIKQVCHIEKFQVRRSKLILNHIFQP
ncbi:transposase (plasmid) [Acinetobacter baumannii ATCC 17978]|uniref:transposase n=1 Tax=Acinetobacter baumannii TaxID=470 RepID=UPI00109D9CC5|nr:transposase [Acinetobacter baumannii]QDQ57740.1 transposase [Acinetobacter baumannii ATCC 17978]